MLDRYPTRRTVLSLAAVAAARARGAQWRCEAVRRFAAPEANQAVAVDESCFYAIGNHVVAKYDKSTGKKLALWECERGKPLIHLNSGVVREGVLYCAHSNYPGIPMVSSIERWETGMLRRAGSHSFGIFAGSATWLQFHGGHWFVTFGHYGGPGAEPNRDPRWTTLVQFDPEWRQLQAWVYPQEVLTRFGQYTTSGGVFTPDGKIWCTGHDEAEMYVLRFPEGGSTLVFEGSFGTTSKGQGIALDPSDPALLYGIDRAKREVVVARVSEG